MSRRTRVPKFGSWDSSEGTQYTEAFEDARLNKAKGINPNDPVQNPAAFRSRPTSIDASENEPRKPHSRRSSKENAEAFGDPPGRRQIEPPAQRIQVDNTRYVPQAVPKSSSENTRRAEPDENSQHKSPMHHRQAATRTGNGSPSWERRPSTEGSATPGRSRLRNSSSNTDPAEKTAALPKFGAWDANDPASGDGFTVIFNNARNEKKAGGAAHVPPLGFEARSDKDLYPGRSAPHSKSSSKLFCCFQPTVMEA